MRGRKPKPTKIHILEGGRKKTHRALPENEPKPDTLQKLPRAPKELNDVGKKEWKRTGKELQKLGLLTQIDLSAFHVYCEIYSQWVDAVEKTHRFGTLVKSHNGFPKISDYVSIANKASEKMAKFLTEFGMTPSSRSRINVPKPEKENDPLKEYLNRRKNASSK